MHHQEPLARPSQDYYLAAESNPIRWRVDAALTAYELFAELVGTLLEASGRSGGAENLELEQIRLVAASRAFDMNAPGFKDALYLLGEDLDEPIIALLQPGTGGLLFNVVRRPAAPQQRSQQQLGRGRDGTEEEGDPYDAHAGPCAGKLLHQKKRKNSNS